MNRILDHIIAILLSLILVHAFDVLVLSFVYWGEGFEKFWNISTWEADTRFIFLLWWGYCFFVYMIPAGIYKFYPFRRK